jgi:hypothetical protein
VEHGQGKEKVFEAAIRAATVEIGRVRHRGALVDAQQACACMSVWEYIVHLDRCRVYTRPASTGGMRLSIIVVRALFQADHTRIHADADDQTILFIIEQDFLVSGECAKA